MDGYEKLRVYQSALDGIKRILSIVNQPLLKNEYWLKDQIQRAAISVAINIAEGAGRKTKTDYSHFLSISLGSINEVKALMDVLVTMYPQVECSTIKQFYTELGKQLYQFRRKILESNS